jgi:hypothetical protein
LADQNFWQTRTFGRPELLADQNFWQTKTSLKTIPKTRKIKIVEHTIFMVNWLKIGSMFHLADKIKNSRGANKSLQAVLWETLFFDCTLL